MLSLNGNCIEIAKVSPASSVYFILELYTLHREEYPEINDITLILEQNFLPFRQNTCLFQMYRTDVNSFELVVSLVTNANCNITTIVNIVYDFLQLETPVDLDIRGVMFRIVHVVMSERVIQSPDDIPEIDSQIVKACISPAVRVNKAWFTSCPFVNIDTDELASFKVHKSVIENIEIASFERRGRVNSICTQKYFELISRNRCYRTEVKWQFLIMLLFLCKL